METKPYLDYLDKEMTIMGVLSAASVLAAGGVLNGILASDKSTASTIWSASSWFIVLGSMLCIAAGLCFYGQRSRLAWFYGQICLLEATRKDYPPSIHKLLEEADSWATWWQYSWGFTFLIAGLAEYALAILVPFVPPHWNWLSHHLDITKALLSWTCPVIAASVATVQWYALTRQKFSDHYWKDFASDLFKCVRVTKRPDTHVFTRLGPSQIHGVGVFAIVDIPKGQYVFEPDDSKTVHIAQGEIKNLPSAIRELYKDFCVLKDNVFECPNSFNSLTPSWYLNHSTTPNVAPDLSLKFFAIREIRKGEELTADYATYSENELS